MNLQTRRVTWTSAGLVLALTAGMPVVADDTELMLSTPNTGGKPNILFILDTSGSMDDEVLTQEPYDAAVTYGDGVDDCDPNSIYWTDVDNAPDCGTATQFVAKSSFKCVSANGQLMGIGSYADTMVQYRATGVPDVSRWQELQPGNATDLVECQADAGEHGDGTAGELWASNGSNDAPFTSNENIELGWGSAPASVTYTVYDGNYLNWKNSPATALIAKIDILKAVTKAVLNSISDVNVGVMRFNNNHGGPVIKAISDLDADRTNILATIDNLNADGSTPLSETLYEAALYWRGVDAWYGESQNQYPTDSAALDSTGPENYKQPQTNVCSKNFNVLLSDGMPNNDDDTPGLMGNLPGYSGAACDGSGGGRCLDDVAAYLASVDIDVPMDGDQFVTTHTIGFDIDLDILREAADESGGRYFLADDVESLALALLNIISDITSRSLSFTAPSVAVNTFNRTQNLNDLYMTVFSSKTNVHWPGNLKKYRVANGQITDAQGLGAVNPATGFFYDSAKSLWTDGNADGGTVTLGGAAHELPVPASRNLFTNNGTSSNLNAGSNALAPSNVAAYTAADFGLTGAAGEPTIEEMIRWMRGEDIRNEDFDPATSVRNAMGDPLHSQPAAIVYGGSPESPDVVVFTGTNDGYLHAIDGDTGQELWAFVPRELLPDMNRLFFDPKSNFKHYGIDGNIVPVLNDEDGDGDIEPGDGDFVYLLFGMRRGGNSYYALDVTNKNAPVLLWQAQYPEFGQTWSTPVVTRMDIAVGGLNENKAVVVVGGGYDPVHDTRAHPQTADAQGAGIHILDLESGARLWRAGRDAGANLRLDIAGRAMTRAIPAQIRVIDMSGDGLADRMYASDLGGQIWRFDITNGQAPADLVAGGVIAQLGAEGLASPTDADTRRFYNSPDVSMFVDPLQGRRYLSISIGSGYRAHPLDNNIADRFFSIRDPAVFNRLDQASYDNYDIVTDSDTDLVEVSGQVRVVIDADKRGWKYTLPANQKVLANSVTFDNSVFFVGFSPEANVSDPCAPSNGRNFLYQVSVINGDPIVNNLDTLAEDEADAERVTELAQGGIAAAPAFLFPGSIDPDCEGAQCSPPPIGCVGVECFDPGFANNPVRTLWTQDGIE
jgi:type IV pilus assembly protein PilY1